MPKPKTETIAFLTPDETGRLFHELGDNKRNKAIFLVAYRHGLRAAELCQLRWSQIDLKHGRLHVNRAKGGIESAHPLRGQAPEQTQRGR